jgi:RNA polymerase sigma-70 factor (ECF subfamily)
MITGMGIGQPPKTAGHPHADELVRQAAGPFRSELLVHCYRMLGSLHDAEDAVQEAFLRAWRALDRFDPERGSLRTWLYRIATNACLTALRDRPPRRLPAEIVAPAPDPAATPTDTYPETNWLQPIPDVLLGPESDDPAVIVSSRASVRLAFIAALQHLPPRQRAALILRDVLAWRSAEVADLLETTPAAVNSALQRARAQLSTVAAAEEDVGEPSESEQRDLLDRYVAAFERADVPALTALLRQDAIMEMPPWLHWMRGREAVARFLSAILARRPPGAWRLVPTAANRQLAVGAYVRGDDGVRRPRGIHVFAMRRQGVAHVVAFQDAGLFPKFGLPETA